MDLHQGGRGDIGTYFVSGIAGPLSGNGSPRVVRVSGREDDPFYAHEYQNVQFINFSSRSSREASVPCSTVE
jgi:hypothetical protein